MSYLLAHPERMVALTLAHVSLVLGALAIACAIAIPLGTLAARRPRASGTVLGTLGAIYTIPSLALLAVLVQFLGLGTLPIFVALVAYGQFILVRNIEAGLRGIDPAIIDAACGLGLSPLERLLRVELPLALPVMLGGVRVAAVAMVALATLGGYVGGGGLGTLIFTGLTLHHDDMIVAGSLAACALAISADALLRLAERFARA